MFEVRFMDDLVRGRFLCPNRQSKRPYHGWAGRFHLGEIGDGHTSRFYGVQEVYRGLFITKQKYSKGEEGSLLFLLAVIELLIRALFCEYSSRIYICQLHS